MEKSIDICVDQRKAPATDAARLVGIAVVAFVIGTVLGIWIGFGAKAISISAQCW